MHFCDRFKFVILRTISGFVQLNLLLVMLYCIGLNLV